MFVIERDSLEPLLHASRSPAVDFVVQPAVIEELSFRVRSALDRLDARRWALHLEATIESLRLATRIRTVPAATAVSDQVDYREAMRIAHEQAARSYLDSLMRDVKGNVARAARRAGLERESLHRLLRRHGIRSGTFKAG
ncbi:MAG TPA: hypothetical protein VG937_00165 [Polyangiaceae bacterium]|nr:hypothetical protein [Polyangiaceae bacterium]